MKQFIPKTKDAIALSAVTAVGFGLFVAGLCDILNFVIIKVVLFLSVGVLFVIASTFAFKNVTKKNRPEDTLQDNSH
ncbi:hypothetical protein [Winogradskyella bathintestinalis]|uniref:Uncharacterized protein n=1 Tax=Winogradskyella bathintestinalis TaxID=3035208 RepID=A0ABT7ZTG6_9FLAO|nr:hypothetical protein [Winogradskyella bathintestinalis]MDN3492285.1 hypothetical protein [Winogradskyella bathintestinalis]